ncbi:unnamed protein product [Cuscuta campestris]|uniref:Protein kinase domain-containing protein n=1 Tax=Cuscuta campestris TaxID=132261 RepID=A0A484N6H5_9ASTE|nr:unnamed protein product [Cuscuta campestris]
MGFFPCCGDSSTAKREDRKRSAAAKRTEHKKDEIAQPASDTPTRVSPCQGGKKEECNDAANQSTSGKDEDCNQRKSGGGGETETGKARTFTFADLVAATENFKQEFFLGEGGFGKVFKGRLVDTGQIVAIKQLDRDGCQGIREFVVEVLTLSMADHPNLVKLIGYCAEGDQRLLVYEYMPLGAAKGLEYLHDKMKPPVICRDLKCSNILLAEDYHPKLSDFGLAKVGPLGDKTHVSTRVMGTYGYCALDYAMTGQLTFKSDVYSFGVVLLELITGRRAIDNTKPAPEQNLVAWARPLFKDRKKFRQMADPALGTQFLVRGLYQALAIAAMCVQEQPNMRPLVADIVTGLNYLSAQEYGPLSLPSRRGPYSHKPKLDGPEKSASSSDVGEEEEKMED